MSQRASRRRGERRRSEGRSPGNVSPLLEYPHLDTDGNEDPFLSLDDELGDAASDVLLTFPNEYQQFADTQL